MPALGVDLPSWMQLERAIFNDLTEQPPHGIGWWAPYPGTSRRILISDQLYACAVSVSDNMVEAGLHWLEFLDYADRESDRLADAVKIQNGRPTMVAPRPHSPWEELGNQLQRMHIVGVVRALSGALDCLAGTIIGVIALPTSILRADLNSVRKLLSQIKDASTDGGRVQKQFGATFEDLIKSVGPVGWLDWTLTFRHMLVHRGRRIEFGQFVPRTPVLYGAGGEPIPRVRRVTHLPRDPGRSDVEVLLDPLQTSLLTEDAAQTLGGVLVSTKRLIEMSANRVMEVWTWRRTNPGSLPQPVEQWAEGRATGSIGFSGYAPGMFEISPDQMMMHPDLARRLRSAALDDASRPQWASFD
jgi:hypothetical protein